MRRHEKASLLAQHTFNRVWALHVPQHDLLAHKALRSCVFFKNRINGGQAMLHDVIMKLICICSPHTPTFLVLLQLLVASL